MERGGSNGSQKQQKATSALKQLQSTYSINPRSNSNDHHPRNAAASDRPPPCPVREQDQYMPIANVIRIMRRILPPHAKISDDAKETMQECVSEYISFITGEANDRCQREQRKTITADDVLWAMAKLGFDNYIQPLNIYLGRYREVESDRNQPFPKRNAPVESGLMGAGLNFGPGYHLHQHHQSMGLNQPMWGLDGGGMGGYYRDAAPGGSASSSSHAALPNFDPYAQYK